MTIQNAPIVFSATNIALIAGEQFYPTASGRDITAALNRGYDQETAQFDLSGFLPTDVITLSSEYSTDGWVNVISDGGTGFAGGVYHDRHTGAVAPIAWVQPIPPDALAGPTLRQRFRIITPRPATVPFASLQFGNNPANG
jgi:hypothetical protein